MDPLASFKENEKARWTGFAQLEHLTGTTAPRLVRFAGITRDSVVADVACGTGVVALTAARIGARATGVDLTPELIARAKENAALTNLEATFVEGDVEALPLPDATFDTVVSQFGHMFAPRPHVAVKEMLRVLKPGGTLAFSTWPPDLFVGRVFSVMSRYAPPPPEGVSPPASWGEPNVVRERLGNAVRDVTFSSGTMVFPTLSPRHYREFVTQNFGPATKLVAALDASDPKKAADLRRELEETAACFFEDNVIRQDYLLTRATKV
jgi:SAM-dependent methyltransferase